mmetsp:Transcript_20109/g.22375  ORF Transcript_20109/g.22375 Transcript_20109/m.22375 type:complete len:145 (+) Transcript_20109:3-437(+)
MKYIIKLDDDSFLHPQMLAKDILCKNNPNDPHYIGQQAISFGGHIFAGGGAGFVLSRPALEELLKTRDKGTCKDTEADDVTVGICLKQAGISLTSHWGFHPEPPEPPGILWQSAHYNVFVTYHHVSVAQAEILNSTSFGHCNIK